jgi:hypothetical protein
MVDCILSVLTQIKLAWRNEQKKWKNLLVDYIASKAKIFTIKPLQKDLFCLSYNVLFVVAYSLTSYMLTSWF